MADLESENDGEKMAEQSPREKYIQEIEANVKAANEKRRLSAEKLKGELTLQQLTIGLIVIAAVFAFPVGLAYLFGGTMVLLAVLLAGGTLWFSLGAFFLVLSKFLNVFDKVLEEAINLWQTKIGKLELLRYFSILIVIASILLAIFDNPLKTEILRPGGKFVSYERHWPAIDDLTEKKMIGIWRAEEWGGKTREDMDGTLFRLRAKLTETVKKSPGSIDKRSDMRKLLDELHEEGEPELKERFEKELNQNFGDGWKISKRYRDFNYGAFRYLGISNLENIYSRQLAPVPDVWARLMTIDRWGRYSSGFFQGTWKITNEGLFETNIESSIFGRNLEEARFQNDRLIIGGPEFWTSYKKIYPFER